MNSKTKSVLIWIFAFLFTAALAIYQRMTGPTYPVRGSIELNEYNHSYKLLRSSESHEPAKIVLKDAAGQITAEIKYKKFKIDEDWTIKPFTTEEGNLIAELPAQPAAGKLEYYVIVSDGNNSIQLNEDPVVIRFKGAVPLYILWPHILLMFSAMLFSTRTGLEALIKGKYTYVYSGITLLLFFLGGMILGPIVQKFAFDAYWTGWPFGHDLTDNKTLIAFVAWIIAFIRLRKNRNNRGWVIAASIILLLVYLIPHSMFGSELDYSSGKVVTGK